MVYASPQRHVRVEVWNELLELSNLIVGPWCVAGDFNQVLYDHEKKGGAPPNSAGCAAFAHYINVCHFVDLGYKGQPFTWKKGELKEHLDRVLCNLEWQSLFPNCSVTHLPLVGSHHCGLWLRPR